MDTTHSKWVGCNIKDYGFNLESVSNLTVINLHCSSYYFTFQTTIYVNWYFWDYDFSYVCVLCLHHTGGVD